jgi:hypothetical protein
MSHQNLGQNHSLLTDNKSFENVARMRWMGHVAWTGEIRNPKNTWVRKPE